MISLEKRILPLIALRGKIMLPLSKGVLEVTREKSLAAVAAGVSEGDKFVILAPQFDDEVQNPTINDIVRSGVLAKINNVSAKAFGEIELSLEVRFFVNIDKFLAEDGCFIVEFSEAKPMVVDEDELNLYAKKIQSQLEVLHDYTDKKYMVTLNTDDHDKFLMELCKLANTHKYIDKKLFLSALDLAQKADIVCQGLIQEIDIAKLDEKINQKVNDAIAKNQKEYYIREQVRALNEELGTDYDDLEELKSKITALKCNDDVKNKLIKEFDKYEKIPSSAAESYIIRNYLDFACELPWETYSEDNLDLDNAKKVLEQDHYGMKDVKERILEYLAVRKLTNDNKGSILCLYGPPGVGKTSIGKSIARALGRKYERLSLGGVSDEAEIRGHRRTYIGAMSGKLLNVISHAGVSNPLILLDEIDKLKENYKGDPASALLEVLDPAQNNTFKDNYLDLPYDLSKVLFITTANVTDTIPRALLDRMEMIEMNGYTLPEKVQIFKRHLMPKSIATNGITCKVNISNETIEKIISAYTRESGVRELERMMDKICRKIAAKLVEPKAPKSVTINVSNLENYLGTERYTHQEKEQSDEVGAATGLAWTAFGGEILTIEVSLLKGKGEIILTGSLGDVMKESARTAISLVRANASKYGIDDSVFATTDIHIHVPEGATPKDGPSAGITIATAVLSAFAGKSIRSDVAMTGEVTLRGKVLPIGGLREKMLAAKRAGIYNIIVPDENKKDVKDIPDGVLENLKLIYASNVDTVFHSSINGL